LQSLLQFYGRGCKKVNKYVRKFLQGYILNTTRDALYLDICCSWTIQEFDNLALYWSQFCNTLINLSRSCTDTSLVAGEFQQAMNTILPHSVSLLTNSWPCRVSGCGSSPRATSGRNGHNFPSQQWSLP